MLLINVFSCRIHRRINQTTTFDNIIINAITILFRICFLLQNKNSSILIVWTISTNINQTISNSECTKFDISTVLDSLFFLSSKVLLCYSLSLLELLLHLFIFCLFLSLLSLLFCFFAQ
jgi:hypothetical protein